MIQKQNFQEAIAALVELGYTNNSTLTPAEIHYYLQDILDNESQYAPVYQFLKEKNIEVKSPSASPSEGSHSAEPLDINALPDSEKKYFTMYFNDLKKIPKLSAPALQELIKNYLDHPEEYLQQLIEQHLFLVTDILSRYQHLSARLGDILQEGNLGLMEGVLSYKGNTDLTEHLKQAILCAIDRFVESESESARISEHLLDRINALERASRALAEEYGREATLQELSDYLHLPEEEVEAIMKHSINAVNSDIAEDTADSGNNT